MIKRKVFFKKLTKYHGVPRDILLQNKSIGSLAFGLQLFDLRNAPDECRQNDKDQGVVSVISIELGGDGGQTFTEAVYGTAEIPW